MIMDPPYQFFLCFAHWPGSFRVEHISEVAESIRSISLLATHQIARTLHGGIFIKDYIKKWPKMAI